MAVIAGIDEAGYGPLLGPLVVSSAVFRAPCDLDAAEGFDLWDAIGPDAVLRERPKGRGAQADPRLAVADSKALYQGGRGLARMEEAVLAFHALACRAAPGAGGAQGADDAPDPWTRFAAAAAAERLLAAYPWYAGVALDLPRWGFRSVVRESAARLGAALARGRIEALAITPHVAHPREFNGGVREAGNKHLFEWQIVAERLAGLFADYGREGVLVSVDRLSGRTHYGPSLARIFPKARVTARLPAALPASAPGTADAAEASPAAPDPCYEVRGRGGARMIVRFLAKGDSLRFEIALASMASKVLRELFMEPLNAYFAEHVPGLKPTAGYVEDGRRFLAEVAPAIAALGVDRDLLVRVA